MAKKDKKPDKIDMAQILGPGAQGSGDQGEIELLDPGTGRPMQPGSAEAEESPGAPPGEAPADALAAALAEKDKYLDLWIRSRADFENSKKRIEREREEERTQAGAALVRDLLPVLDNLERALAGAPEGDPFRDGVAMVHRQLGACLARAGLEPIDALGVPFNPLYHEAVLTEPTDRFEPNRVLEVIQKGYVFRGRVLRPSLVKVAVRPEGTAGDRVDAAEGPEPGGD